MSKRTAHALRTILTLTAIPVLLHVVAAPAGAQSVPEVVNFQGRLTDNTPGQNPVSASVPMTFRIYGSLSGGDLLWSESWPAVTVSGGLFSVLLGSSGSPIPATVFSDGTLRYLEVEVNGETLTPRQRLGSVGWANHAQTSGELQCSDCLDAAHIADDAITGSEISDSSIQFADLGMSCAPGDTLKTDGSTWFCGQDADTTYSGANFALSNQSCPAGQFMTGIDALGSPVCSGLGTALRDYINTNCYVYLGWRDNCSGCTTGPSKWGRVNDAGCANGVGTDNTCGQHSLGGNTIRLFGLNTDGSVADDDKFYVGLACF